MGDGRGFCWATGAGFRSDLHAYNIEGPVFDQVSVLSKFIWLGMSMSDVINLSTAATARTMGLGDRLGTLRPGAEADVTLLRVDQGRFAFADSVGRSVTAKSKLSHVTTVKGGLVYRPWQA